MEHDDGGEIITFYSYKGGTGRTMALANVAWILAANGGRVLAVDWDLEAPGLAKFYRPFLSETALHEAPGVLNLIMGFAFAAEERARDVAPAEPADPSWLLRWAQLAGHTVPVSWDFGGGFLHLLPAGSQNGDYANPVSAFDWKTFYENQDGAAFLGALRQVMKRSYDYVLIDSRTGRSDIGDICTVLLPDTLVNCFTMSDQSIEGAAVVARRISERYSGRRIRILPVPMRLDLTAEKERLDVGRETVQERFDEVMTDLRGDALARYWRNVEVPYLAFYSYEEILAVFGEPAGSPGTVLGAFERLTEVLTRGAVTGLPPMPEPLRRRHLEAFVRQKPARRADIYLSHARRDRSWADWVEAVLVDAGYRVARRSTLDAGPDLAASTARQVRGATKTVALLSRSYLHSEERRLVAEIRKALDPVGNLQLVVPLRVGGADLANPFPAREAVNLDVLTEQEAIEAVQRVIGVTPSNPPGAAGRGGTGPRYPGAYPPVWSVPTRNPFFTGRVEVLERLRDRLGQAGPVQRLQVLHGLGGMGKSQIALEYAHRFRADYDVIWWIPSEEPNRVAESLAGLATRLDLKAPNAERASAEAVTRLSAGPPGRRALLIYDNPPAERLEELRPLVPTGELAHVIVTSRHREVATLGPEPVDINVFTRTESIEHLQRQVVDGLGEEDAGRLAEMLGDLPIVVALAAAWLKETGRPVDDYLAQLGPNPSLVLREVVRGYDQPVSAVWQATIDQLRTQSPAAVRLLELCAFFGPEPIATRLFYSDAFIDALQAYDSSLGGETLMVDRLVMDLGRFALARVDLRDKSIQVHPLLQELVRDGVGEVEGAQMKRTVRRILARMRPRGEAADIDDPRTWPVYRMLWPHLSVCEADGTDEPEIRELMVDRVRWLSGRGQIGAALELGERMLAVWQRQSPPDELRTLSLRFEIASALRQLGRPTESLAIDEEVYRLQQESPALGPEHLHSLRTAGSLAADLRALGRWDEALDRDRATVARLERLYGPDHARTLTAVNNLATSLRITGRCFEARDRDQSVYDRRLDLLGPAHQYTLGSAVNLARSLRDCGLFPEALRLLRATLARCERELGEYTPVTLFAARGLAVAERRTGLVAEARERTERAVEHHVDVFGDDAPETLSCRLNLACDESAANNKAAALRLASEVHDRFLHRHGPRHPDTLAAANNVSIYRRAVGDLELAERLAAETYVAMTAVLGTGHPFTLSSGLNWANALAELDRPAEGLDVAGAARRVLGEAFGELHPDTLACDANRAAMLRQAGRDGAADQLQQRTDETMSRVYAQDHHDLVALRAGRRLHRDLEPHRT